MGRQQAICIWLDIFIQEKGVDLEQSFEVSTGQQYHLMTYGVVVESIKGAPANEQTAIKNTLVRLDFTNASIEHYLRHLGWALARQREEDAA